ncbi:MAG: hypothetical protein H6651_05340 [Ardenticatenales bacterium]|nr:hypothetical protein [Ardenticatenales bacterium]
MRLFRITILFVIALTGVILLTRQVQVGPELAERGEALGVAAPAGSRLNAILTSSQSDAGDEFAAAIPVTMYVSELSLEPRAAELSVEQELDSPLSLAEQAERQQAALDLPPDPQIQIASAGPEPDAPILGVNFAALDYAETATNAPPDPEIAVGPNHIVAVVNVAIQIYSKTGSDATAVIPANNFFGTHPDCDEGLLYDPNVVFDEEIGRYLIGFDMGPFSTDGGYCLAVSQTSNPTGAWFLYFFHLNNNSTWVDFPQAAVTDSYITVTGNLFDYVPSPSTNYMGAKIWAFNKSQLYAGGAVVPQSATLGDDYFTMQPLHLHGVAESSWPRHGQRIYFLADQFDGAHYSLFVWEPGNVPVLVNEINLGQGGFPINVPQNGPGLLRANDYRLLDFEYRNNYGWLTQTVSCNPGGGTSNCLRWAQILLVNGQLGPAGSGTYGSSSEHRIYPDLAINRCNDLVIGYTKSSTSSFPGIWFTGRKQLDSAGTLQAEAQLKAGEIAYTSFASDPSPHRWGDYTGMTIDPDGLRFWYIGEYSKDIATASRWGTYIGAFTYPNCQPINVTDRLYLPILARP